MAERAGEALPEAAREGADHDELAVRTRESLIGHDGGVTAPDARHLETGRHGGNVVAHHVERGFEHRDLDMLALGMRRASEEGGEHA